LETLIVSPDAIEIFCADEELDDGTEEYEEPWFHDPRQLLVGAGFEHNCESLHGGWQKRLRRQESVERKDFVRDLVVQLEMGQEIGTMARLVLVRIRRSFFLTLVRNKNRLPWYKKSSNRVYRAQSQQFDCLT